MNIELPSISEIRNDLRALGYRPSRWLGQCFLTDKNLVHLIVEAADVDEHALVFEVGAGAGSLTQALAARAGRVVSIELDSLLFKYASGRLREIDNIMLIHGDALAAKSQVNPAFVEAVEHAWNEGEFNRLVFVSNLPYSIATPLIAELLLARTRPEKPDDEAPRLPRRIDRMVVMVQQEVADRLMAGPGSKDFGQISVLVQSFGSPAQVRKLGPQVFWPRPKISSTVVRIDSLTMQPSELQRMRRLMPTVASLFQQRRKMLRNILRKTIGLDDDKVDRLGQRFDLHRRVGNMDVAEIAALAEAVQQANETTDEHG